MKLFMKKNRLIDIENKFMLTKWAKGWRVKLEVWD